MRKIAIISINGVANVGGVERVVNDHRRILSESAQVRVFCLPQSGWIARLRRARTLNALIMAAFPSVSSLAARAWAGREGIVLSHGFSSTGLFCNLVFAHGCWAEYLDRARIRMGPFDRIICFYEWLCACCANKVVSVSDSVAEEWQRYYHLSSQKSVVLTNSVNTAVFRPVESARDPCSNNELRVLFVGRLETRKGLKTLAQLHEEMAVNRVGISMYVCSPSAVSEEIKARFHCFEFQCSLTPEALVLEYSRADLFLLPSLYEAFEMSTIEALACGTPVILNNTGARPTLEKMQCPAVYRLEEARSPREAVLDAARRFHGMRRADLARWTEEHFGGHDLKSRLTALCGLEQARP
jgi:glycosyltransferase involved in cell wall biosynthesis